MLCLSKTYSGRMPAVPGGIGRGTAADSCTQSNESTTANMTTISLNAQGTCPQEPEIQNPWHSRGYLPHYEAGEHPQSICFRLYDSLPKTLRDQWEIEINRLPDTEQNAARRKRIDAALDEGYGECWLGDPRIAEIVEDALLHFDGQRYKLHAWSIMPNHVHVLMPPIAQHTLSDILHSWKSYTALKANHVLERSGAFWQEEYFDRAIRDETHFCRAVEYIEGNPVKAGLCQRASEWFFGSAHERHEKQAD